MPTPGDWSRFTSSAATSHLLAEGNDPSPAKTPVVDFRPVSPEYFKTMSIPLRQGRIFDDRDLERPVALVSASTARRVWPGRDPIGQRFRLGSADGRLTEVIGVVGDVRGVSLNDDPAPTVYLPGNDCSTGIGYSCS